MITVRVPVDDAGDRLVAGVLTIKGDTRRGALRRDQRIDHDDPGVTLDDRHVRQVEAANLIDAGRHLRTGRWYGTVEPGATDRD